MNDADIIALAAKKRSPYEVELLADARLATTYLSWICKGLTFHDYSDDIDFDSNSCLAYYYASIVICGRWVEAERIIIRSPRYAAYYACYVTQCRWAISDESIIARDRYAWDTYRKHFNI